MKSKAEIREEMITQLTQLDNDKRRIDTENILKQLQVDSNYQSAKTIGIFYPMPLEIDVRPLLLNAEKTWLLPKIMPHHKLAFFENQTLVKNEFGIMEPQGGIPQKPALLIVPGLAWNADGYRIGFGGGYYDRYLAKFQGTAISLAFDFQLTQFEPETHDIPVEKIITA